MRLQFSSALRREWWWFFVLTASATTTNASMLESSGTGGWATGLAYNPQDQSYLIGGTLYDDDFWGLTLLGNSDAKTQCFVAQASHDAGTLTISKRVIAAIETPEVCVGGMNSVTHGQNGFAAVTGTAGNDSMLQLLTQTNVGSAIAPNTKFDLPTQTIPVATTVQEDKYVYVALHGTNGLTFSKQSSPSQNLRGLVEFYWFPLAHPPTFNQDLKVVKFDTMTLEEKYTVNLEFAEGGTGYGAITAVATTSDSLLVAGSSNGRGVAFGNTDIDFDPTSDGGATWNGFLAWFDINTGAFQRANHLDIVPMFNDYVEGMCIHGDLVYIVGTTWEVEGAELIPKGFIVQLNVGVVGSGTDAVAGDGAINWKLHVPGQAVKCVADESGVYVAKYVTRSYIWEDSPVTSQAMTLSKYTATDHVEKWGKQIDTTVIVDDIRQDYIAGLEFGGPAGNVVALMNSIHFETGANDIRLIEFLKDTGRNDWTDQTPSDQKSSNDEKTPEGPGGGGTDSGGGGDVPTDEDVTNQTIVFFAIFIPALLALWVIAYHFSCRQDEKELITTTRESTDVNDLSLEPSQEGEGGERELV